MWIFQIPSRISLSAAESISNCVYEYRKRLSISMPRYAPARPVRAGSPPPRRRLRGRRRRLPRQAVQRARADPPDPRADAPGPADRGRAVADPVRPAQDRSRCSPRVGRRGRDRVDRARVPPAPRVPVAPWPGPDPRRAALGCLGHRRGRHDAHRRHPRQAAAREARRRRRVHRDAARRRLPVQGRARGSRRMSFVVAALALIATLAIIALVVLRRAQRGLIRDVQNIVRDPTKRIAAISVSSDMRELARWINAIAEDAERSRDALHHERTLLASVADGLTQGVIAIDGERKIEMLNDAARRMLGVQSSLVGEPLLEFVRVPELRELLDHTNDAPAAVQLPHGPRALLRAARTWGRAGRVLLLEDVTPVRKLETVRRGFVANVSPEQ